LVPEVEPDPTPTNWLGATNILHTLGGVGDLMKLLATAIVFFVNDKNDGFDDNSVVLVFAMCVFDNGSAEQVVSLLQR